MRAVIFKKVGGPEVLEISETQKPVTNPEQILVKVKAFALNRADLLQRRGKYPPPAGESDILGLEMAGDVEHIGSKVTGFRPGDRVFGLVGSGAYAEYCLIDQGMAIPIPDNLTYEQAASIPEAFLTAQEAVFTLGELKANEKILIHAGGSGVGSAAIQLAKQVNATVFTTTSTERKKSKILNLGADIVLDYKDESFPGQIRQLTDDAGVNVIVDFIGAKFLMPHLRTLHVDGRLIVVGLMGGTSTDIDLSLLQKRRLQIKGLAMRSRPLTEKRAFTQLFRQNWLPLFVNGKLQAVVDSVFPFEQIQQAHKYMESNTNIGKIVIRF